MAMQWAAWMVAAGILMTIVSMVWRVRLWRRGAAVPVDLLRGLLAMPRRYLVDVHHVVSRNPANARMHVFAAGSFVALLPAMLALACWPHVVLAWLVGGLGVTQAVGGMLVIRRRRAPASAHLSGGRFRHLGMGLLACGLFAVLAAASFLQPWLAASKVVMLLVIVLGLYWIPSLLGGIARAPLRHALAGALHLAVHPRPERFSNVRPGLKTALRGLPQIAGTHALGTANIVDFSWTRLVSFDACVQCGRCESVCPAYASGMPLNPKRLIADLVATLDPAGAAYTGSPHPRMPAVQPAGDGALMAPAGMIAADTLWACTTCRACVEECPMLIEHVDAIVDMRRAVVLRDGKPPAQIAAQLRTIEETGNTVGARLGHRHAWLAPLGVPVLSEVGTCDVLLWLGDGAFDLRGQRTLRAFIDLLKRAGIDFAILGDEELDCGHNTRRFGDEVAFVALRDRNLKALSSYRYQRIVTVDPHVLHTLKNEYSLTVPVVHHTEILVELLDTGRLSAPRTQAAMLSYHDPCYLGRYNDIFEAPREILRRCGVELTEPDTVRRRSNCCGGGGGSVLSGATAIQPIPIRRLDELTAAGQDTVAVACPGCTQMFESVPGRKTTVLDVVEILHASLEPSR